MFVLLWISCSNKQNKEEIVTLIEHWKGKEIIFPETSTFIQGKDTVVFSIKLLLPIVI